MLSLRTIQPHTLELLKAISALPEMSGTRLVGGTALALQYGHRTSIDLDFFGDFDLDTDFAEIFGRIGAVRQLTKSKSIRTFLLDGVKIDLVHYAQYPWIDEAVVENGIRLASPLDIAAMKVQAIDGRGSRKDFVDLYYLLQRFSLEEILQFYERKYPQGSRFRALMGMAYFEDAETSPMPHIFDEISWGEIRTVIQKEVAKFR
ncbi:MAG: nucleotidyl transferase AbiEii/AbiGii toxin family protein [Bacteroidales bacterium]|nr:nucleotidyl transferase AbiEii/AbiGii toxin family protein [Bacteroidales bacterium]